MEELGERLKNLRKAAKVTQNEFAEKLNVHTQTVSKWERGISEPDISQMGDIAAVLGISLEKLFGCGESEQTFVGTFSAEKLGAYISFLRTAQNESQQQLAEICASSADAVSRWERGVTCPDVKGVRTLAEHFNVPVSKLYYAVSEEEIAPLIVKAKKKRGIIAILASALAAATVAAATILTVFLLKQPTPMTVTVDGVEYTVGKDDWFTPVADKRTGYDFAGWQNQDGESVSAPIQITQSCELSAVYVPHIYTIRYWLYGGTFEEEVQTTITVESGEISLPLPQKKGATFAGWYAVPDYSQSAITTITCGGEDVQLYAKWENVTYTVTIDGKEFIVDENDWFTPQPEERVGYEFVGWKTLAGDAVSFPHKVTADCTFYSEYTPHEYQIDYWLNGGAFGASTVQNTFHMESGELTLPVPQKAGAVFEGWYFSDDYSGSAVTQIICNAADVSLYAKWSDSVYTVRYDLGGGILYDGNPTTVTKESEIKLAAPIRKGYLFLGWFDDAENRYGSVGGTNARNLTLHAVWQKSDAVFAITYELNGGILPESNPASVKAGEVYPLNDPQKRGHDFFGWNDRADGSGAFYTDLYGIQDDLTLYAIFAPKQYLILYEYDGVYEYGTVNPNYVTFGQSVTLASVYKNGYTFAGWFDAATGGTRVDTIDESNILLITTLYARFTPNVYEITLNADGGIFAAPDGETQSYTYRVDFETTLELPACTKGGYVFLGWKNKDGKTVEKIDKLNIGNMTLTAAWRESDKRYSIAYELNGGALETPNPESVLCGQVLTLSEPKRENYIFLGWYDNAEGKGNRYEFTPASGESDLTLYALWQEIKVSGSSKDFDYEKNVTAGNVTITGYHGAYGENVDLVIPSVIEGLPVVAIEGMRYSTSYNYQYLRSLTIPEGIVRLGDHALKQLGITLPVSVPASVEEIGESCFLQCRFSELSFAEGSKLKTIGESAFESLHLEDILHLPAKLEELGYRAFYMASFAGIILPDSLKRIDSGALLLNVSSSGFIGDNTELPGGYHIYLPSGVEYIASRSISCCTSGMIYAAFSESWAAKKFAPQWNYGDDNNVHGSYQVVYGVPPVRVTLHNEDKVTELTGNAFELPVPEKEGYTFIGWRTQSGSYINQYLVTEADCELYAVYEQVSEHDGRALNRVALLSPNTVYEFAVRGGGGADLYFRLNDVNVEKVILNFDYDTNFYMVQNIFYFENGDYQVLRSGEQIKVSPQGYFKINLAFYQIVSHVRIWITVLN